MGKKNAYIRNVDEKIDRIFKSFEELISKSEYRNITTNHIADNAKIGIGTIYRYFPKGKIEIAHSFYRKRLFLGFELFSIQNIKNTSLEEYLPIFISDFIDFHKKNWYSNLAFEQAVLEDRALFADIMKMIDHNFSTMGEQLHELNEFQGIPVATLIQRLNVVIDILEAIVHRHLLFRPVFPSELDLIKLLSEILTKILLNK